MYLVFDPGPYLDDDIFPNILVNRDDVLDDISVVFGVVEMKDVWRTCIKRSLLVSKIAVCIYFCMQYFKGALYSLSPNNDYGWGMTLQPYSYSSPVVKWRGEHLCGLEWQHLGTDASDTSAVPWSFI